MAMALPTGHSLDVVQVLYLHSYGLPWGTATLCIIYSVYQLVVCMCGLFVFSVL